MKNVREDAWHAYSGHKTATFVADNLPLTAFLSGLLLNAGAGIYDLRVGNWKEIPIDIFDAPIMGRARAVCASVERLPFQTGTFAGIVCVGEVLGYCDPAMAIREFARVLAPTGILICDFGSSRSLRYLLRKEHGRSADLVTDQYNGMPERIWIYDPAYVESFLLSSGFEIKARSGSHTWSALARRMGANPSTALFIQRRLEWLKPPSAWSDLTMISAVRIAGARE